MEEQKQVAVEQTETGKIVTEKTSRTSGDKNAFQAAYLVYYILGALEILLAFRLVLKLLGANPGSGFVDFIYSVSNALVTPFRGIFSSATTTGVETTAVLEPSTIIAMIVYGVVGWGIAKLIGVAMADKN